ncbi:MAG TPA: MrpF/PhaF family protein [Ilumatobacter sp.]|nr:MrpF/PhaF family protein [Ilumatobacter sp.]
MNVVTTIAIGLLALAAAINAARAIRPGTVVDRAIAFDGIVSAIISGIAIGAVRMHSGVLIDVALVGGLLGFLTLATVARYVGRRGA